MAEFLILLIGMGTGVAISYGWAGVAVTFVLGAVLIAIARHAGEQIGYPGMELIAQIAGFSGAVFCLLACATMLWRFYQM